MRGARGRETDRSRLLARAETLSRIPRHEDLFVFHPVLRLPQEERCQARPGGRARLRVRLRERTSVQSAVETNDSARGNYTFMFFFALPCLSPWIDSSRAKNGVLLIGFSGV